VDHLKATYEVSLTRACGLTRLSRSSYHYQATDRHDGELRETLKELAKKRRRWGYRRLIVLLRREGYADNPKRVFRVYQEEGLQVPKRRKRKTARWRGEKPEVPSKRNERWSLDFVSDQLANGRRIRTLNVVDDHTRECLAIEADTSLSGRRVTRVLTDLIDRHGRPERLVMDNGPEFTSQVMDNWAYEQEIKLQFIEPGKPVQNAYVESFNGKFRDECLNEHWFVDLEDARWIIEAWRVDYNQVRPHSSLGNLTPSEFVATAVPHGGRLEGEPSSSPNQVTHSTMPVRLS
jgi:putative transposase